MPKIDLDKFICSLLSIDYKRSNDRVRMLIEHGLKEQGYVFKNGAIVKNGKEELI